MSLAVPLLLLLLLATSNKSEQQFQVRDENTDVDVLCSDPNVTMNFTNLHLGSLGKNFIISPIITCLELKQNEIREVNAQTFDSVPNLKYLQMSLNFLNLNNVFSNRFENLEVLILDASFSDNNPFRNYDDFRELTINTVYTKLRKLFLRNNGIDQLSINYQTTFPSLTHLYLTGNNLRNDNFAWLPESLEYLDLTSNMLNELTLKNLRNLKRIFIDKSFDKSLHSISFINLIDLEYLSASSNRMSEISSRTFANISSLLYLDLSGNNIKYIEGGSFDSMIKLQFLNLSSNSIEIIQGGIFEKLSELKVLILDRNSITMFPMTGNPSALELISLSCNKIKTIVGGTFAKMPLLETLLLHGNEITNIDQEAFTGLEKLKVLTLSKNKLSVLPQHWMEPLLNLEELDLAGNHFLSFGNLALSKSFTLRNVYLSNQVLFMETASLIDLPVNATISFDTNFSFVEQCNTKSPY